jgi:ABC-2 type transporter
MTATTPTATGAEARPHGHAIGPVCDALAIAGRNLIALRRVPSLLVFSTIQPVVFLLLFRYVFGGVVSTSLLDVPYVDYLMPGIFVQTSVFGAIGAAIGLGTDLQTGLLERFRSLPMTRSAVLAGRTLADLARNVFVVALMVVIGVAVGFRIHTGPLPFLGGAGAGAGRADRLLRLAVAGLGRRDRGGVRAAGCLALPPGVAGRRLRA